VSLEGLELKAYKLEVRLALSEEDFKFWKVILPSMLSELFVPVVVIPRGIEVRLSTSSTDKISGLVMAVTTTGIFETLDEVCHHSTTFFIGLAERGLVMSMVAASP
jgi:hypothetical protein